MESRDELGLGQTATLAPTPGEKNIGRGAENAAKRKERLKALREQQRKRKLPDEQADAGDDRDVDSELPLVGSTEHQLGSGGKSGSDAAGPLPVPKAVFRTYRPANESLKGLELPDTRPENIDDQVKKNLAAVAADNILDRDINIDTLQSHKPDWDLKRGIAKQLDKLERRTKRAIAELVRERLQADKDAKTALAQAVKSAEPEAVGDSDED